MTGRVASALQGPAQESEWPARQCVQAASKGIRNVTEDPAQQEKIRQMGFEIRYMRPEQFSEYWAEEEARVKELLAAAQ